jgi:hypothetical protein
VLAALKESGIRILLPRWRARGVEFEQPAFGGNHIHIMRTTSELFKVL